MNSCILMAKIVRSPELRYTQDTQTPVSQMLVEFEAPRPEEPPATLKVVGWGNLATEIQAQYSEGDRVIVEGRLSMNLFDRPEGFKEKRAELVASRIHLLASGGGRVATPSASVSSFPTDKVVAMDTFKKVAEPEEVSTEFPLKTPTTETTTVPPTTDASPSDRNLDEIPF